MRRTGSDRGLVWSTSGSSSTCRIVTCYAKPESLSRGSSIAGMGCGRLQRRSAGRHSNPGPQHRSSHPTRRSCAGTAVVSIDQDVGVDNSTVMQLFAGPANLAASASAGCVADAFKEAALRSPCSFVSIHEGPDCFGRKAGYGLVQRRGTDPQLAQKRLGKAQCDVTLIVPGTRLRCEVAPD